MRTLVFVDLDDTLFQSRRKCPTEDDLSPVASLRDGSVHSFMTAKQRALWRLLDADAILIPTTARDLDSLCRVDLPFQSWRILDYGGVILEPGGHPDTYWMRQMTRVSRETIGELNALLDLAETFILNEGLAAHVRIIEDFGLPFYLVAKYRDDREDDLNRLQHALVQPWVAEHADAYRLHRNGNNLAVLPCALGKEHAVRYLIGHLSREGGELLTIGIGDSLIDGAFMAECDYAITPRGTQLFEATLRRVLI